MRPPAPLRVLVLATALLALRPAPGRAVPARPAPTHAALADTGLADTGLAAGRTRMPADTGRRAAPVPAESLPPLRRLRVLALPASGRYRDATPLAGLTVLAWHNTADTHGFPTFLASTDTSGTAQLRLDPGVWLVGFARCPDGQRVGSHMRDYARRYPEGALPLVVSATDPMARLTQTLVVYCPPPVGP